MRCASCTALPDKTRRYDARSRRMHRRLSGVCRIVLVVMIDNIGTDQIVLEPTVTP